MSEHYTGTPIGTTANIDLPDEDEFVVRVMRRPEAVAGFVVGNLSDVEVALQAAVAKEKARREDDSILAGVLRRFCAAPLGNAVLTEQHGPEGIATLDLEGALVGLAKHEVDAIKRMFNER